MFVGNVAIIVMYVIGFELRWDDNVGKKCRT